MDDAAKLQTLFQTLGDANRLRIIKLIGIGEQTVSAIVQETKMSQPLVSHHLRILREAEILVTHREGPFIYHRLKDPKILEAIGLFLDIANSMKNIQTKQPMFFCPPMWRKRGRI